MRACKTRVRGVPVQSLECHVTFVHTDRPKARATLVGVTSLVAVAAVDAADTLRLSVTVATANDVAQSTQRGVTVGTREVFHVPTHAFRFDAFVAEYYLHSSSSSDVDQSLNQPSNSAFCTMLVT